MNNSYSDDGNNPDAGNLDYSNGGSIIDGYISGGYDRIRMSGDG